MSQDEIGYTLQLSCQLTHSQNNTISFGLYIA